MPRGKPNAPLVRGAVYGTWTVVRESAPNAHGQEQWMCRASCCGREKVMLRANILHAPYACRTCAPTVRAGRDPAAERREELYDGDEHDAAMHERVEARAGR